MPYVFVDVCNIPYAGYAGKDELLGDQGRLFGSDSTI